MDDIRQEMKSEKVLKESLGENVRVENERTEKNRKKKTISSKGKKKKSVSKKDKPKEKKDRKENKVTHDLKMRICFLFFNRRSRA